MAGVQSKKTSSYNGVTSAASDASFALYAISIDAPLPTASESPRTGDDEWDINLFDCLCAPAHCCVAVFLPFVSAGYVANGISRFGALVGVSFFLVFATGVALALAARAYDPDTGVYVSTIFVGKGDDAVLANSWSVGVTVCALLFLGGVALLRRAARKYYGIRGSCYSDCCSSFWFSWCVLTQMTAHMQMIRRMNATNDTLPAYTAS